MPPESIPVTLSDGTRVQLRPVTARDKERLQRGLQLLSEASRYLRFFAPVQRLSEEELRFFTEVDQVDHVAWGAETIDDPSYPGCGIARYVRLASDPEAAELAITVVDDFQQRGLGTLLAALLYLLAYEGGIRMFRGKIHPQNRVVLRWLRQLGAETQYEDGLLRVQLPVAAQFSGPDTPSARRFRAALAQLREAMADAV